jgi:hypothetical protein
MPAHDFLKASDQELLARADECLQRAGSALDVPPPNFDEFTRLRLFLEAQSCLAEILRRRSEQAAERDRKRNEEIAERDHILEIWVIRLISVEIVLSLLFGFFGLWEGRKQGKALDRQVAVLGHMDTSTAAQSVASQKTLDSSRIALEGMVQLAQDQQGKMSKTLGIAQSQQNVLSQQLDRMNTLSRIAQAQLQKQIQEANLHPILLVSVMTIREPEHRVTIPANGGTVSVWDANVSVTRKSLAFFIRNVGNTPLKNPRITANVGSPNKFACLDYISFGLEGSSPTPPYSIEYCKNELQVLPDILPNPDPTKQPGEFEFLVVYDEVPGTAFFNLVVVLSADNFPTTSYGVQVQYRGLFPCGAFCK